MEIRIENNNIDLIELRRLKKVLDEFYCIDFNLNINYDYIYFRDR